MRRTLWPLLLLVLPGLLTGCGTTGGPAEFSVAPNGYAAAFESAKNALTESSFELDRVDAGAGVITTKPKETSGLATPWDVEQSSLDDEWEELLNRHYRRVRITFEPADQPAGGGPSELRTATAPIVGRVEVSIDRVRRSGWRLETTSMRFSSFARDPALVERGMWPQYTVPISQDPELAARLAQTIRRDLDRAPGR